jgi:hypothetical protein
MEPPGPKAATMIEVRRTGEGGLLEFEVVIREGDGRQAHA